MSSYCFSFLILLLSPVPVTQFKKVFKFKNRPKPIEFEKFEKRDRVTYGQFIEPLDKVVYPDFVEGEFLTRFDRYTEGEFLDKTFSQNYKLEKLIEGPLFGKQGTYRPKPKDEDLVWKYVSIGLERAFKEAFYHPETKKYQRLVEIVMTRLRRYMNRVFYRKFKEKIVYYGVLAFGEFFVWRGNGETLDWEDNFYVDCLLEFAMNPDKVISDADLVEYVDDALDKIKLDHPKGKAYVFSENLIPDKFRPEELQEQRLDGGRTTKKTTTTTTTEKPKGR